MKKLFLLSALLIFACSSDSEGNDCIYEPTLSTEAVTDITETSATLNGVISIVSENCDIALGGMQGFVYSTNPSPTNDDNVEVVYGTDISASIEGLEPETTYYVRVFITNSLGEFYGNEVSFTTNILDETPPVITIIGDNPLEINIGEDYIEFGATAIDDIDGDITQDIIIDSSNINTTLVGSYGVTYSVADSSNNLTVEVRVVIVIDNSVLFNCDGNPVPTIVYGTQEWTVENACHITYRDGTPIPEVTSQAEWVNLNTGAWSYIDNDPTKPRLYNWYAVAGIHDNDSFSDTSLRKEFAPEGWRVPSRLDWDILQEYFIANGYNYDGSSYSCNPCPEEYNKIAQAVASTTGWISSTSVGSPGYDQSLNNSSGFNALPGGLRIGASWNTSGDLFAYEGLIGCIWSSSGYGDINSAWGVSLGLESDHFSGWGFYKKDGYFVRLIRGEE